MKTGKAGIEHGTAALGEGTVEAINNSTSPDTPLKHASQLAVDFVAAVGKLSDDDAVKAIEVLKSGLQLSLMVSRQGKAAAPVEKKTCPVDGKECDRCGGCRTTACEDCEVPHA